MRQLFIQSVSTLIILLGIAVVPASGWLERSNANLEHIQSDSELKSKAFQILKKKCNTCHRKQNPFMVFNEKNMVRRATKIYRMVFIERKMPKGNLIKLTGEEYRTLEKWLLTQKLFKDGNNH